MSFGRMPTQPWLVLADPMLPLFQGASWMNSPLLVSRMAYSDFSRYSSGASMASLVQILFRTRCMITCVPLRVCHPGLPPETGNSFTVSPVGVLDGQSTCFFRSTRIVCARPTVTSLVRVLVPQSPSPA